MLAVPDGVDALMSGFGSDWLRLREPFDAAARDDHGLAAGIPAAAGPYRVLDLGAGTGANLRYLAPRLGGEQLWTLVDHDAGLLEIAPDALRRWAQAHGWEFERTGDEIRVHGVDFIVAVRRECHDLFRSLDALPWAEAHLVTASALLDLVSEVWFQQLIGHCGPASAALFFALTYDGRVEWTPSLAGDARIVDALNRHQRGDKGFGAALGPAAAPRARQLLEAAGYRVREARSDWRMETSDHAMQARLIEDWSQAVQTMPSESPTRIETWRERRLAALNGGDSRLCVGHIDLLATPRSRAEIPQ